MTKLAVYEKKYGLKDGRINAYFRNDYIYRKNMFTRFTVISASALIIAVYWAKKALVDGVNLIALDLKKIGFDTLALLAAIWFLYTAIGVAVYARQYVKMQKRQKDYLRLLKKLHDQEFERLKPRREEPDDYHEEDRDESSVLKGAVSGLIYRGGFVGTDNKTKREYDTDI